MTSGADLDFLVRIRSRYSSKMSASDVELQKMVRGFRVSDLQSLLVYAGRNKAGKKSELQNRALDLIKLHSDSINMKIRELHINRYQQGRGHADPDRTALTRSSDMYPLGAIDNPTVSKHYGGTSNHQGPMGLDLGIPSYISSLNRPLLPPMPDLGPVQRYPVNPEVTFKDLPFYDVLVDLLKPTSLVSMRGDDHVQEKELLFYLRPQDLRELDSNTDVQVQFRIGCLESNREQEDEFPTTISVRVNHRIAALPNPIPTNKPGQDPKRPKRPVDITFLVRRSTSDPNILCISWASTCNKPYVVGVFLVRKQSSSVLIKRLKDMGVRNPDHTTAMIKEKMCNRDSEIAFMSLKGSLNCPLGKIKMQLPCRAITCTHLQCFDATLYVQMNEKKPKWICPVCDKPAEFKNLAIDGLFLDIARKAPPECTEVQFHENGSWTPLMPVKKPPEIHQTIKPDAVKADPKPKKKPIEVIDLDSGSDTEESWAVTPPKKKTYKPTSVDPPICIDTEAPVIIQETVRKFPDVQPSHAKNLQSNSSANSSSVDKSGSSRFLNYGQLNVPSTFPLAQTSEPLTNSSYQETTDVTTNSSSSAGQCSNEFDFYSLIIRNDNEIYDESTASNPMPQDDSLDIISID